MANEFTSPINKLLSPVGAVLTLAVAILVSPVSAQQQGPVPAPPASPTAQPAPPSQPVTATAAPAAKPQSESGTISHEPPSIPVDQIIQKFGERELEFKKERDNYTYNQSFVVQVIVSDGQVAGEHRMNSDILFTPDGKLYEKVTSAPPPTLECSGMRLLQQDLDDFEIHLPYLLTRTAL